MKKLFIALVILVSVNFVSNSFAFLDYLFSGSSSRDAIDNTAVGDLRAWWSGNPVYTFNPYYSGGQTGMPQGQQSAQPPQTVQPQQPIVSYYPPSQGGAAYPYGQQQYAPQPQMYQQQPMQAAPAPQYPMGPQTYQYQTGQ